MFIWASYWGFPCTKTYFSISVKFGKVLLKIDLNNIKNSVYTELKVKKRKLNCDLFSNKKVLFFQDTCYGAKTILGKIYAVR